MRHGEGKKMWTKSAGMLVLLTGCMACAIAVRADNVLSDSDFSRSGKYWKVSNGAQLTVKNGKWELTLNSIPRGTAIRNDLPLQAGREYVLSGEMSANPGANGRVYIEWILNGAYFHSPTTAFLDGTGAWKPFSGRFAFAGANTSKPYLVIEARNGGIELRNLVLNEIPVRDVPAIGGGAWQETDCTKVVQTKADGQQIRISRGSAWLRRVPIPAPGRYALRFGVEGESDAGNVSGYHGFETLIHPNGGSENICRKTDDVLPRNRQFKEVVFEVKPGVKDISIEWANRSTGTLVLGDVALKAKPLAAEERYRVELDMPNYRDTIYASHPLPAIAGKLTLDENVTACRNELRDHTNRVLAGQEGAAFDFTAKGLSPGEYELASIWGLKNGTTFSRKTPIRVRPPAKQEVVVGADRQLYVNGELFFPIVFYQMPGTWEKRENFWREAAAGGVNTILLERGVTIENLDLAERCGLKVMAYLGNIGTAGMETEALWREHLRKTLTPALVNHPALLGYFLADEPSWGGKPLAQLLKSYELLKEADPNHPIWINAAPRGDLDEHRDYSASADIYGVDIYPVPSPDPHGALPNKQLSVVGDYATRMSDAVRWRKPNWMILQAFAWGVLNNATPVYPTQEQLRFMVYDALLNGGTAVVFWGQIYIRDQDFYRKLLKTTRELHATSGLWTQSRRWRLQGTTPETELQLLEVDGRQYLIALNRSPREATFSVRVPWARQQVKVHFEDRNIPCAGGVLSDKLPGFGVRIYSVDDLPAALYRLPEFSGNGYAGSHPVFDCDGAGWIWAKESAEVPGSRVFLFREFTVDPARPVRDAVLTIGADDSAEVIVNGQRLGTAGSCRWLKRFPGLTMKPGRNFIGIEARDGGGLPCGVIGALEIKYTDGGTAVIPTDNSWRVVPEAPADWSAVRMDTLSEPAFVVSALHSGKWINVWGDKLPIQ